MAGEISLLTIVVLVIAAIAQTEANQRNVAICEDQNQFISCGQGEIIRVLDATYGRKKEACGLKPNRYCGSESSVLSKIQKLCENRKYCFVHVTDSKLGNPCWAREEYLDLTYECKAVIPTTENPIKQAHICENQFKFMSCTGGKVFDIKSAFYGRRSQQPCQGGDMSNTRCQVDATRFAKHYCQGKSFCVPSANSGELGDPCPGISKYMKVEYECVYKPTIPTTENPIKKAHVCENQFKFMSCTGGKVFDIKSAFYGRRSQQPCQGGDMSNTRCQVDATKYAKHYCQGKSFCVPSANSGELGDACPGISKYMEIEYECKDKGALATTAPPTPPILVSTSSRAPIPTVSSACGISYVAQSRIVGGKDATPGAWPWQVALYRKGAFICGGSLINPQWIVTATHCLEKDPLPFNYQVVLGDHDRSKNEGTEVRMDLEKVVLHPEYSVGHRYNNDIALIKMVRPVIFNTRIAPICLPSEGVSVPLNTKCFVTGWGWTVFPGNSHSVLQQGMLPIVSKTECSRRLRNSALSDDLSISDKMLCAGFTQSTQTNQPDTSACRGDSGGPFVCKDNQGKWTLQGAVSWGSMRCSDRDRFSVFARVSEFRNWIDIVVRNNGLPTTKTPTTTSKAATPGVPPSPGVPSTPGVPPSPGVPSTPGVPPSPGVPSTPGVPPSPGVPSTPGVPPSPGVPSTPGVPPSPGVPSTPGVPPSPGVPSTPGVPPSPGVPSTPAVPPSPGVPFG